MKGIRLAIVVALMVALMGIGAGATAAPIVALDTDPTTPGIQERRSIRVGTSFPVDILISGVEAALPLNGFELDLAFDPLVVVASSAAAGGFLLEPVVRVESHVVAASVGFAAVTAAPIGASGSGVLVRVSLDAVAPGTATLDLRNVLLSAPFGVRIPFGGENGATVEVTPVPEPRALLLFALGSLVVAWSRRGSRAGGRS
ncbi:MAG: cohesin domain-containing protein [Myxococcota bacterium]|nr:cohesin domain-containing protein [Myxococcota bacterium]